jgi:hypothetical protein
MGKSQPTKRREKKLMDILIRAQGKVVKFSENGSAENVVEITSSEFNELLIEIVRCRSVLEEIAESQHLSMKRMRRIAREGILPE